MLNLSEGRHEYTLSIENKNISFECDFKPSSEEVVLFIHGLGCSRESFRDVFDHPYFPDKSFLLLDLIGFGKSSKPGNFSYSLEDQAKLCVQFLLKLQFRNIHIVAHSMGAAISLLFPTDVLLKVHSFANIEGNLISEDCGLFSRGISNYLFNDYHTRIFKEQQAALMGHPLLRFEETISTAVHRSSKSLVQWSDSGELLSRFKRLSCKKSYFFGEKNAQMPVLQQLDGIKTFMIPQSGHGLMTENPKAFYTTLAEFIRS
ncbi:MAG: alpha/beta hydrolase [Candidatus Riflebacteria bacterium]|nr:alpha/beta hydrolase [Candidatus Riflebacteria bacterium]